MRSVIKFRSLFLALLVFTTSGYAQAEQTMEQTEKWLNDYARNEIRFVGADFGERNRHIDYAFSECKLTGRAQYHYCDPDGDNNNIYSFAYPFTMSKCEVEYSFQLDNYKTDSFHVDFSKVRPHEVQAEGNNVIKVKDETAWSKGKQWARTPIVVKPDTINRGVRALKHYAKLCSSELDSTF